MGGLVAIVSTDGTAVAREELAALAAEYESLRGARGRVELEAPGVRALLLAEEGDPRASVRREGEAWAAVCGVPYGDGLGPEGLDGRFALVASDGTVAADPFALQGLFVAERAGRLLASTSALALARLTKARPSRAALLSFLRAGMHWGALTHWEGIERLEPGTAIRPGGREVYWRPQVDDAVAALPFEQALDRVLEVSLETFRRQVAVRPSTWSDLTGGYDSRTVALLLAAAGADLAADTRGPAGDPETRIGSRVAAVAGWPWTNPQLPADWPGRLPAEAAHALAWADGHLDAFEMARIVHLHRGLARERRFLQLGGGGDHLRGHAWRQEFLNAGRSNRVDMDNWIDMRLLQPLDTSIFAADPTPAVREDFRARMLRWAEPYADRPNTTQLDVMHAYKMTGHFGVWPSGDDAFMHTETPLYAKDVFATAFSVDHRHRDHHKLMRHLIHRLDPRVSAIETTTGGPAEPWRPGNLHRFLPYYALLGRKAVGKLSQRALGRPLLAPKAWTNPLAAGALAAHVRSLGSDPSDWRSAPLYDGVALRDFLLAAREPGAVDAGLLGRVLTVELALEAAGSQL